LHSPGLRDRQSGARLLPVSPINRRTGLGGTALYEESPYRLWLFLQRPAMADEADPERAREANAAKHKAQRAKRKAKL